MEFSQLRIFQTVAAEGSVNQAARKLSRVPSNISIRLKQLEEELGVQLFSREKLRLRLTEDGQIFLEYSEKLLQLAEEARTAVSGGTPKGLFSIGSILSTAAVRAPSVLAAYHRLHKDVELDFSTGASDEMMEGLLSGAFTAIFIDDPVPHPDVEGVSLWQEEMMIVTSKDHAPVRRARDVAGESIYAFRRICSYRRTFEAWFEEDKVRPGKIFEMESYHSMLACASAGAGITLAPLSMLKNMPAPADALSIWPIHGKFQYVRIWLCWKRGIKSSNLEALRILLKDLVIK